MAKSHILSKDIRDIKNSARKKNDILDLAAAIAPKLHPSMRDDKIWDGRCDSEASSANLLRHIEHDIPNVPRIVRNYLAAPSLSEDDYLRRAYAVLDTIDHLVGVHAHPNRFPIEKRWIDLKKRLIYNGRYNTDKERLSIIPARYNPQKDPIPQFRIGRRLCFVDPIRSYKIRYRNISLLPRQDSQKWRVAVVPAPHNPDSAKHRKSRGSPKPQYDIYHNYSKTDINALCASLSEIEKKRNKPIVIFPEAALNWDGVLSLHNEFRQLSKNNYRGKEQGIQLLLLGNCGTNSVAEFGGYNTVAVMKRPGELAWSQTKLQGYPLSDKTIKRDNLNLPLLNNMDEYYSEKLEHSSIPELTVADTPYGRFMIVICEDAAHLNPSLNIAEQAEVTHLILPVLDKQLRKDGWYHSSAKFHALRKCITIVANSAFFERHVRLTNNQNINDPLGVLLINYHHRDKPKVVKWDPKGTHLWVATII